MSECGNTPEVMLRYRTVNKIAVRKATRGPETSKYPEEKKETSILQVAASERGRGQTESNFGVADHSSLEAFVAESAWKGQPKRVRVPYAKQTNHRMAPEYHRTRETRWEAGGPTPQA